MELPADHPAFPSLRFYEEHLRAILEPAHNGEFVAIDGPAKLYALGKTPVEAHDALCSQGSTGWQLLLRVGSEWTFQMLAAQ